MQDSKVSIIGAGSWGTTLGVIWSQNNLRVNLFSLFPQENKSMVRYRENKFFLKGVKFPDFLMVSCSWEEVLSNEIIVLAIPVQYIRKALRRIKKEKLDVQSKIFVNVSKGIEYPSLKRVSQIVEEELGKVRYAVLSGPTIAKEVIKNIPTAAVIASYEENILHTLQQMFTTPYFRIYTHKDVIGVELGGSLKNIIALACGIADGLGFGTNTKSALISRGILEMVRLGKIMGAEPTTFWGISGLGDLTTTCFSPFSRNRSLGERLGKGEFLEEAINKIKGVAEGVKTTKSVYKMSKIYNIDMPITQAVYKVIYNKKDPREVVKGLMSRPLKREEVSF